MSYFEPWNGKMNIQHTKHFDYPECYRWRRIFAWLPKKTISGKIVWLKLIYKQHYYIATPWVGQNYHMWPKVEYGDLFDILKENNE
jgi:hypothetical protein